jgi:hypothetical protein
VCDPLTVKVPPLPLTTPAELLPSPHVMTAVYDEAPPNGSTLAKVATAPLNEAPPVALMLRPVADSRAGVTVSVPAAKAKL